jgi:hypothetical protein
VRTGGCTSTMQLFRIASATQNPICRVYLSVFFHIPKVILEMKITDLPGEIFRALFIGIAPTFYAVNFWIHVSSDVIFTALKERAI